MTRRAVITGMGTVNSLGSEVAGFWKALCAGQSGVGPIEQFDTSAFKVHFGGEVKNFEPEKDIEARAARKLDRFSQFALVATKRALADAGID
ncbi:MAG: beta-ketoacyl synthase N-terminal-like domain-containing protein, partial [Gemmataceae bacterium]